MDHPHVDILRRQDEAGSTGDMEGVMATFTDDVVLHVAGRSSQSGTYKGKEELAEVYGRYLASIGSDPVLETHAILADDDHMVQLVTTTATKGGETMKINTVNVFHVRDGQISEMWTIDQDPYTADPFYDSKSS